MDLAIVQIEAVAPRWLLSVEDCSADPASLSAVRHRAAKTHAIDITLQVPAAP
jgi:hypothetical protein